MNLAKTVLSTVASALIVGSLSCLPYAETTASALTSPVVPVEPDIPAELRQFVDEAAADYAKRGSIVPETMDRLRSEKAKLLPFAAAMLSPERIKQAGEAAAAERNGNQAEALTNNWKFWASAAMEWHDQGIVPALDQWLPAFPVYEYEADLYSRLLDSLVPAGDERLIVDRLARADAAATLILLELLDRRGYDVSSLIDGWAEQSPESPQMDGMIGFASRHGHAGQLMRLYDGGRLPDRQKQSIVDELIGNVPASEETIGWLKRKASETERVALEQTIDQWLFMHHGDADAGERLYQSGEKYGFASKLDGKAEKLLAASRPEGSLAKGIAAYEAIRGKSYFYGEAYSYEVDGDDFKNPARGIESWLGFIAEYPLHPSADDAAYRLARCYQLAGQAEEALYWFDKSNRMGDRDLEYDARGMMLYVLDVEMSGRDYAALHKDKLPDWMRPWIEYAAAVDLARDEKYGEASSALARFIDTYGTRDLFAPAYVGGSYYYHPSDYPFWAHVSAQQKLMEKLAKLKLEADRAAGAERAAKQYELAAAVFRQPLLYYNHLWRGSRSGQFMYDIVQLHRYDEKLDAYLSRFNHLIRAASLFEKIDQSAAGPELGAKAMFSAALSYAKLSHYGAEVSLYLPFDGIAGNVLRLAKQLADTYPESELADDALMLGYDFSGETDWLRQIGLTAPNGDQAEQASELLRQRAVQPEDKAKMAFGGVTQSYPAYQQLERGDIRIPVTVLDWMDAGGKGYHGTMIDGGWVYAYASAAEGESVSYMYPQNKDGRSRIVGSIGKPNSEFVYPAEKLIRIPLKFVYAGDLEWSLLTE